MTVDVDKIYKMNSDETIADRLNRQLSSLTRAERQLAHFMLENYPVSGLGSITAIARSAGVSTPTVARMVQKLGFKGFPAFKAELRRELQEKISDPIERRETWAGKAPDSHILNRFTEAATENIRGSLAQVPAETFDECVELLADTDRRIHIAGGRVTGALAEYLFLHLQMVRDGVVHIKATANSWPHYLLDVQPGHIMVIFDIRRYENGTLKLAEMAREKGADIVLFTDQWRSPIHKLSRLCFATRTTVPSAWDSSIATLLLIETLIAAVQEKRWGTSRSRVEALEEMFDRTRLFRKFT